MGIVNGRPSGKGLRLPLRLPLIGKERPTANRNLLRPSFFAEIHDLGPMSGTPGRVPLRAESIHPIREGTSCSMSDGQWALHQRWCPDGSHVDGSPSCPSTFACSARGLPLMAWESRRGDCGVSSDGHERHALMEAAFERIHNGSLTAHHCDVVCGPGDRGWWNMASC